MSALGVTEVSSPPDTNIDNSKASRLQTEHQSADLEKETAQRFDVDATTKEEYTQDVDKSSLRPSSSKRRGSSECKNNLDEKKENGEKDDENAAEISSQEDDINVVWWDGPNDPHNPLNFSKTIKIVTISVISGITFVTPLASSMFAPGVPQLMQEFESTSVELGSFVVSVYVLGFAIGPLLFAPLSEIYGRLPIYHLCNVGFLLFTVC